jgi:serine/threonine protein kinase
MDFIHQCEKIANAPRRINISRCEFNYENRSYHLVLHKVKSHNKIKIYFGDLYINGELSKQIVVKAYESLSLDLFDLDIYSGLVEEIQIHSMIESKIGYSNYNSHMLFHFCTETCIGIIYDYFGTTLDKTDLSKYSLKSRILMVLQLINQINFLQQNDIYHGDLKPPNICITPNDEIVLIDFGIGYLKEFYCDYKLQIKYNTNVAAGSPEYNSIYLEYHAGKEYPKELFDKSQHFAIGGLIYEILISNPSIYFKKCCKIMNMLKSPNENLENLNLPNRFKYFNQDFCKIICDFISQELDTKPELQFFKPIILNMFEYDYKKRLNLEEIIQQIQKIEL